MNVSIDYAIKDFAGEEIYKESEERFVSKVINIEKEFDTSELEAGDYVLGVEVVYAEGFSNAGQKFTIFEIERVNFKLIAIIIFILVVVFLIIILLMIKIIKKKLNYRK